MQGLGSQGRQGTQGLSNQGTQGVSGSFSGTWIRKTTADPAYTANSGDQIIADTSGGTFTITLPATPSTGSHVLIADGASWSTTNLTVGRNGSTIEGLSEDLILDINDIQIDFVYDGTSWEVYTTITSGGGGFSAVNYILA
jgi:hypothetical protein